MKTFIVLLTILTVSGCISITPSPNSPYSRSYSVATPTEETETEDITTQSSSQEESPKLVKEASWGSLKTSGGDYRSLTETEKGQLFVLDFRKGNCGQYAIGIGHRNSNKEKPRVERNVGMIVIFNGTQKWAMPMVLEVNSGMIWFRSNNLIDDSLIKAFLTDEAFGIGLAFRGTDKAAIDAIKLSGAKEEIVKSYKNCSNQI